MSQRFISACSQKLPNIDLSLSKKYRTINASRRFFYSLLVTALLVSVSFIAIIPASAAPFGNSTDYGYVNAIIARKVILDEPYGTFWNPDPGSGGTNWESGVSVSQFAYVVVISNNGFPIQGVNVTGFYTAANGSTNLFPFSGITNAEGRFNTSTNLDNHVRVGQTSNAKGPNEGDWNVTINVTYNGTTTSINRHFILGEYGCGRSGSGCHAPGGSQAAKGNAMAPSAVFSHDPYIQGVSADGTSQSAHMVYQPSGTEHNAPTDQVAGTNCETCHRAYNQDSYNTTNAYLNNATPLSGNGLHEANGVKCKDCHKNTTIGGVVQIRYEVPQCYDSGCHTNTINIPKKWVQSRNDSYSWNQRAHNTNQTISCVFCHGPHHNNTKPNTSVPLVANGVTESENCANNCHKNQGYHNATVQCTVCHSQAAHEIRYFNSTGDYTYNKTQNQSGWNVGRKYAGKCSTCHQKPYFARLLNHSNNVSDPYDAANGSYSKGPSGARLVSDPLGHSNAQNNGSKWGNYWNASNDSDSCMYCHGNVYNSVNFTFTDDALGHVWQFMGNNIVNSSISSSSYWCASCHWQGYTSGNKTYNDMVSSFLSDNDPAPPEITGNATYGANQSVPGYRNHNSDAKNDASCKNCHGGNLSTSATITDFMHNLSTGSAGEPETSDCMSCHNSQQGVYPAIVGSSFAKHKNVNTTNGTGVLDNNDCMTCHYDTTNMTQAGFTTATKACTDCHIQGNYSAPIIWNHRPPKLTPTAGANITTTAYCSVCHNNSINQFAYSVNASVGHYGTNASLLKPTVNQTSRPIFGFMNSGEASAYNTECNNCHNPSNLNYGNATMITVPHIDRGTCNECHVNADASNLHNGSLSLPQTFSCLDCHTTYAARYGAANITGTNMPGFGTCDSGCHGTGNGNGLLDASEHNTNRNYAGTPGNADTVYLNNQTSLTVPPGTSATVTSRVNDAGNAGRVGGAEYYIDTPDPGVGKGIPMNPADGQFNASMGEWENVTATIDTANLSVGTHTVYVRGMDIGKQWSATQSATLTLGDKYIPPAPSNLASIQGIFWINYTWQAGAGNKTDSYNFSVNGGWTNGTTSTYSNNSVGAHNWSNITVWAYNNSASGSLSLTSASQNTRVANNVPVQAAMGNKAVTAGNVLTFTVSATDVDSDPITYATNATKGTLNPTTGVYTWTTTTSDVGTYIWSFNSSDTFGGVDNETITVTVDAVPTYVPPAPTSLASTQGNFWVNYTWQAGAGNKTDSYNVSVNGLWTNGTANTYSNNSVGSHGWSNITVYAYNSSGSGKLSLTSASQNTRVANNVPVQATIGDKAVMAGNWLNFTVSAIDADSDPITYGSNKTKGALNSSSGAYSWLTTAGDLGTYRWYFNSSDNYGGVASETITVTVTSVPVYTVSGYVFDNNNAGLAGVLVQNGTNQTITSASGSYTVINMTNGTYNFSYSKTGFSTGYLVVTISGADVINANKTINDTTPPASVTNLTNVSYAQNYINWTWTDPTDPDFAKVMVYLNGAYQNDILKGVQYYNVTVAPGTYTIGTRTVGNLGNVNTTWANHTATTILPSVRYINGTVKESGTLNVLAGVTVSTNTSISTATNATGFYSLPVSEGTYALTAVLNPTHYTNSTVTVSTVGSAVVVQDIELVKKPTGTITGSVTVG